MISEIIKKYGSDTLRMHEMFLGPIEQSKPWNTNGIDGVFKFLNINSKSIFVGDYFINTTSHKDPEYLILSNTSQLEAAKLLSNAKIVLVMPAKIDK